MCQLSKKVLVPYRKLVENVVVLYGTQAKKSMSRVVNIALKAQCCNNQTLNKLCAIWWIVCSKEEGIQYRTDKTSQRVGRMIFYRKSYCYVDFIQL